MGVQVVFMRVRVGSAGCQAWFWPLSDSGPAAALGGRQRFCTSAGIQPVRLLEINIGAVAHRAMWGIRGRSPLDLEPLRLRVTFAPPGALITGIFDPHIWSSAEAPGQPQAGRGSMKGPPVTRAVPCHCPGGPGTRPCQEVLTAGERVPAMPASTGPPGMCGGPPRRGDGQLWGVHLPAVRGPCSPRARQCATACRFALMGA
jgi:hypothetical protein